MEPVLNLNNEVVKMRKDVKKVKVLIIRRLTRHIAKLKAKKGTEELVVKNQRRAQRLLEEIHAIKELKPDIVTKAALRKEINFDKVFKQPSSTAEDRAIARIATYPLMKNKIAALKDAIKAFKDARRNLPDEDSDNKAPPSQPLPVQKEVSKGESKLKEGKSVRKRKTEDAKQDESKAGGKRTLVEPDCPSEGPSDQSHLKALPSINKVEEKPEAVESVSETIKSVPEKRALVEEADRDSSDIEDSDKEDKEYFDDSTEERFHKQSSGFEDSESESEDDFFIGKVRQTKKKKSDKKCSERTEKKDMSKRDVHGGPEPKTVKLQSVFCKSLSDIKQKSSYVRRDIHAAPAKNRIPVVPQANKLKKAMPSRGPAAKPSSKPRESLHPSWEASRRRKEQQSQITAFQGKKIIFDD